MAKRLKAVNPALAATTLADQCKAMAKQDKSREERLAKALRENLKRRKTHARQSPGPILRPPAGGDEQRDD